MHGLFCPRIFGAMAAWRLREVYAAFVEILRGLDLARLCELFFADWRKLRLLTPPPQRRSDHTTKPRTAFETLVARREHHVHALSVSTIGSAIPGCLRQANETERRLQPLRELLLDAIFLVTTRSDPDTETSPSLSPACEFFQIGSSVSVRFGYEVNVPM
jgi:hypothetical protein